MKYTERDALVSDLRELADFIEQRGHKLPIDSYKPILVLSTFLYGDDSKDKMTKAAKNIGWANKKHSDSSMRLERPMRNGTIVVSFNIDRKNVCTPKVVGTKKKPKMEFVEVPNEFVEEPIIEWECSDPLIA